MDLPQTLHGQLYLLAYDRNRRRFDLQNLWLLGFALRAAMLTDLFLNGYLRDTDGLASPADGTRPGDPVLRAVFDTIGIDRPKTWSWLIAANQAHGPRLVRDQLKDVGWLCERRSRTLGVIPITRLGPHDENLVEGLAERVTNALRDAIAGRPTDPRPLVVGLLGVLGEMPTVFSIDERAQHSRELGGLTFAAIAPIMGLHEAVKSVYDSMQGKGGAVGGCGGSGGCGGCGGCGG
jgi:Golgi phosphoprotein 3 (GPP34)